MKTVKVAIAGNPNSGKSTLINAIAGTSLRVGNWPGVTVEKKTATFKVDDLEINLVDLPGTYSLSPYTQEEVIARDFLVKEKPDLIIDVVDSTNFERNLYLTVQLLELGIPVVVALNIFDEAKKKGYEFDIEKLEQLLGVKVIPTVATKKEGVKEILNYIKEFANGKYAVLPQKINYGEDIENSIKIIEDELRVKNPALLNKYPSRWLTIKLLEEDELVVKETGIKKDEPFLKKAKEHFVSAHNGDIESILADIRYAVAKGVTKDVMRKKDTQKYDLTDRIDRILLNRYLGIPLFLVAMWFVFKLTFDIASPFQDWFDKVINEIFKRWAESLLVSLNVADWLKSLVTDGIISGVGSVLTFVPLITILMLFITFLEGSGYMARAAFVIDRVMHSVGLHGKSFIPMLLGFGCNIPSVYATRVLETERDRKLTTMLCGWMSCSARLPVYVLFASIFFPNNSATVIWSMYILGLIIAIIMGFILKSTLFKGFVPVFLMELPPYRIPTLRDIRIHTWLKVKSFLFKAGTVILAISIIIWFLGNFPVGAQKDESCLAKLGSTVSPLFKPLGFGTWQASASAITGVAAKEVIIATMAQIYAAEKEEERKEKIPTFTDDIKKIFFSFGNAVKEAVTNVFSGFGAQPFRIEEEEESPLKEKLTQVFDPLSAYAFMAFVLLYWPCMAFMGVVFREYGWKFLVQILAIYSIVSWIVSFIIYQGGKILGF